VLILPFSVFSESKEVEHIADGICEDIITELSRFRSIAVLARTTAFAFKGTTKTIREVGQEVRASYVLEGSLRPVGSKLRLTVQLIDPSSEGHVWAEKFDFDLSELMITQDLLVSRIVSLLEGKIESSRLKAIGKLGPQSLDAFDCWLKGHALMRNWRIGDDQAARSYFQRATELDPEFARPHASLAGIYSASAFLLPGNPDIDGLLLQAKEHAQIAMGLDPDDGKVLTHLGWVNMLERSFGQAALAFDAAGEANPNDAEVTISRALASAYLGETDRAIDLARHAFELDPYRADYHYGYRAVISFLHGDHQMSVDLFERMQEIAPADLLVWYGSALELSGDRQRHDDVVSGFRKVLPKLWQGRRSPTGADLASWFFRVTPLKRKLHSEKISKAFFLD
jgi:TolB-like protein/Tfp pilus assembly protein PilF